MRRSILALGLAVGVLTVAVVILSLKVAERSHMPTLPPPKAQQDKPQEQSEAFDPTHVTVAEYRRRVGECAYQYLASHGQLILSDGSTISHVGTVNFAEGMPVESMGSFDDECVMVASSMIGMTRNLNSIGH